MLQAGMLQVVTVAVLVTYILCIGHSYYKTFPGYYIEGKVFKTLKVPTLVQCASLCLAQRPQCRAFNVQGTYNNYTCQVLTRYNHLRQGDSYTLFYDQDMYQAMGYMGELGRLVYYPAQGTDLVKWRRAKNWCKAKWGEMLVPRTQQEWEWMKHKMLNQTYSAMWLPIKKQCELGESRHHYYWTGWKIKKRKAPGSLNIVWEDDGMEEQCSECSICDLYYDCGLLRHSDSNDLEVIIERCSQRYDGYICEAAISDLPT